MRGQLAVAISVILAVAALGQIRLSGSAAEGTDCKLTGSGQQRQCEILIDVSLTRLPPPPSVIGAVRLTLEPGAVFPDLVVPGPSVLAVESGNLVVEISGETEEAGEIEEIEEQIRRHSESGTPVPSTGAVTIPSPGIFRVELDPGDQITITPDWPHQIRNEGAEPAVVLAVAITPPEPSVGGPPWPPAGASPMELPPGVSLESLDVGYQSAIGLPAAQALDVRVERYVVSPAEELSVSTAADGVRLLAVESGSVAVSADGEIRVRTSAGEDLGRSGEFTLSTGDRALIEDGIGAHIRGSDAPATLLVIGADAVTEAPATPAA